MPQRLLLLTGSFEAGVLIPFFARHAPAARIEAIHQGAELEAAVRAGTEGTRLLGFCTATIVPPALLALLPGPSYNIHPGPPSFPGRHPECWGAYRAAPRFGATLHEMASRVDEGPIVDVQWFEMTEGGGQAAYGMRAYQAAIQLLMRWAPWLVNDDRPLPRSADRWSGTKTRRADIEAMCRVTPDIDEAEFERRRLAFAEQPGGRMSIMLHGREFKYEVPPEAPPSPVEKT
ncbi:MAG TPA: formyltransferase family protein [Aliidongia sp.]|uniref:formyltransferase family protein n=1 Tax=Aliidongia sp. TaxID=1914230 RepID=UPI002DDD428F|nr:formyltransferase family protein [Aliidongia sp.]HEV2678814.1 formyltransferase family protein [Aliidongia sp.]